MFYILKKLHVLRVPFEYELKGMLVTFVFYYTNEISSLLRLYIYYHIMKKCLFIT